MRIKYTTTALVLCVGTTACAQTFIGLGELPGFPGATMAENVSGDGSTIVGSGSDESHAFRWTQALGMQYLGDVPGGAIDSKAWGVSFDGSVVAGTSSGTNGDNRAFRWTSATGLVDLGVGGTGVWSQSHAVSADGDTIVGHGPTSGLSQRGILEWREPGAMLTIRSEGMSIFACNADASIVGGLSTRSGSPASIWSLADGFVEVPGFDVARDNRGVVLGMNPSGTATVGWMEQGAGFRGFIWTPGGITFDIGELPGGIDYSRLEDVSANAFIAVGFGNNADGQRAIIWTKTEGLRLLKDYLETDLGLDLTGWTLESATGISDNGDVIVGYGTNPSGTREAFRAEIPIINNSLCEADFEGDYDVDLGDFGVFGAAFNSTVGDANYALGADFDRDGDVDLGDFGIFGSLFGQGPGSCEP